jgi:hypothetical protein
LTDIVVDGQTRVSFVASIANILAPTAAELTAGILLMAVMTPDGLIGFEPTTADVDNSALNSTFDTKTIGRDSFSGTMLRFKKQLTGDTAYSTIRRGVTGFIAVRRDLDNATAWLAAQNAEVYPVIFGLTRRITPASNEVTKWEIDSKITSSPSLFSVVA